MKKQHISLLLILIAIAFVLVAGCTSPTQNNAAPTTSNLTTNASTSASTTATSAVSPKPTSSASPSPSSTPSSTPTSTPAASSGKIATTIQGNSFFSSNPTVPRGSPTEGWGFNVVAQGKQPPIVCGISLTALIDGHPAGIITSQSGSNCFTTANYELSAKETAGLSAGTHTLTISFAGDNTYQPTKHDFPIEVT